MKIPEGMTEDSVVTLINTILSRLTNKFKFGYFENEDMFQEGWIIAIEALEKYNAESGHPLEHYLRVSIRNRFITLKRDKFSRYEPPCHSCPFFDPENKLSTNKCAEFADKMDCEKWAAWIKRNKSKQELSGTSASLDNRVVEDNKDSFEFIDKVNSLLDPETRKNFLKIIQGVYLPFKKKQELKEKLIELGVIENGE